MTADLNSMARENSELREQLREAEELLAAIRTGAVDALAVHGPEGPRIFTLTGADQNYRTLIEEMSEGAVLLSRGATMLYCNAGLADLLGYPLEKLTGGSFLEFVPAGFAPEWEAQLAAGWAGKARGELPLQNRAGRLRPCTVSMNLLTFDGAEALAVLITDLSAQREINAIRARVAEQNDQLERQTQEMAHQKAERQAIEQAAAEASRLLEGIPEIAWTASPDGRNTYLNQRWFDYTGHESVWPMEARLLESIHPDDLPAAMAAWQRCMPAGVELETECRIRRRDGQYRWMLGRARPSRNAEGEITQWIGTYADIHEHKLALQRLDDTQHELEANNAQLTRVNVDLDNFIYTASHDLKAPITNIEGLLDALLTELPPDVSEGPDVRPLLVMMQDSVNRFQHTIDILTDVSRLQKEEAPTGELVDVAAVVAAVQLDLEPMIRALQAQVQMDVAACPVVPFSEKNLRSVVYNLLSNALKYRHASRVPQVRISCRPVGDQALLTVQDNGLGLAPGQEEKLFGMFQRLHTHVEGSGIGLYMVKKMVENVGGSITVASELGTGSTFAVYLPRPA